MLNVMCCIYHTCSITYTLYTEFTLHTRIYMHVHPSLPNAHADSWRRSRTRSWRCCPPQRGTFWRTRRPLRFSPPLRHSLMRSPRNRCSSNRIYTCTWMYRHMYDYSGTLLIWNEDTLIIVSLSQTWTFFISTYYTIQKSNIIRARSALYKKKPKKYMKV